MSDTVEAQGISEDIARCVVFPNAKRALGSSLMGQEISYCALIRLHSGRVFFFRSRGHAWLSTRVSLAARLLQSVADTPLGYEILARRLAQALGISNLEVLESLNREVDENQWSIRPTVRALSGHPTHVRKQGVSL